MNLTLKTEEFNEEGEAEEREEEPDEAEPELGPPLLTPLFQDAGKSAQIWAFIYFQPLFSSLYYAHFLLWDTPVFLVSVEPKCAVLSK